MALKHMKPEKRVPAFHLMVTGVVFIVAFLLAVWVFSSPAEVQSADKGVDALQKDAAFENTEDLPGSLEADKTGEEDSGWVDKKKKPQNDFVSESDADVETLEEKPVEKPEEKPDPVEDVSTKESDVEEIVEKVVDEKKEDVPESKAEIEEIREIKDVPEKVEEESSKSGEKSELTVEAKATTTGWETQSKESKEEKADGGSGGTSDEDGQPKNGDVPTKEEESEASTEDVKSVGGQSDAEPGLTDWKTCSWANAEDYIPCLDNKKALKLLPSTKHYEHRERHCPATDEMPKCLVPLPRGYQVPIRWPESRTKVWYANVPHTKLASYKKDQNWVKQQGDYLMFPGGGTQFKHGAGHYIEFIQKSSRDIEKNGRDVAWGSRTRVILDVGCGVASFGGFLFDRDVLAMSLAPKDEHEAQVQFALERGIPAISAVMGTQRLPFPSNSFDLVHCARCRVPWHIEDGMLLLELNRVLRPGGFFVWSATPVYKQEEEERAIWKATTSLTSKMCWDLQARTTDASTGIGLAIFQKPTDNVCYNNRKADYPPMCDESDKADAAWYVPLKACIHRIPEGADARGPIWPADWPHRLEEAPAWLSSVPKGLYGKPASEEFNENTQHWQRVINNFYLKSLNIDWSNVRNIMDMSAGYGGFAAGLAVKPVWVMNVVPTHEPDTLPIIFDRGLFGIYHDWCESFNSYPRTYDLIHADHVFSRLKAKAHCGLLNTLIEVDRIMRPEGWIIIRDKKDVMEEEVLPVLKSLQWVEAYSYSQEQEQLLVLQKSRWRPDQSA